MVELHRNLEGKVHVPMFFGASDATGGCSDLRVVDMFTVVPPWLIRP